MSQLNFARDVQGMNAYAYAIPTTLVSTTLAAAGTTNYTVPSDAKSYIAKISCAAPVWVSINNTVAVPAGATFATTNSMLITPTLFGSQLLVNAGDVIHVLNNSTGSQDVGIALFANT